MAIYVIGDLHLGFSTNKPMSVFGEHWRDHHLKIAADWQERVKADDLVILAGDTSWANTFAEAETDLAWIDNLNGKKLILKGNHDYWWQTLKKMRGVFASIEYLQNDSYVYGDYVIVGTRGWEVGDNKIFRREVLRFELSLQSAPADKEKICVMHYPPFAEDGSPSAMTDMIEAYDIKQTYFGHIHSNHDKIRQGEYHGCQYHLISADYLDFKLEQIV